MANNKKFVVKNGLTTSNIEFKDDINNGTNTITMSMLSTDVLSFSGDSGQLFSISDSLTGTIFSVNDISGIPSLEVDDDGTIRLAEFTGNVLIGTATDDGSNKLQLTGDAKITGNFETTGNISVTGTVDGRDVAADGTKLDGIESGATADQTAAEILTAIKTVDGAGSGLDADLLDGQQGSYYLDYNNLSNTPGSGAARTEEFPTVTNGSAAVTMNGNYAIDKIDVFLNGAKMKGGTDYTVSGTTLTFSENLQTGDVVALYVYNTDVLITADWNDLNDVSVTGASANDLVRYNGSSWVIAPASIDSSGNLTVSGYLAGPSTFTIDPAGVGDNTGTVVIAGDLQVGGTTITVNSQEVAVGDKVITLGSDATADTQNNGAGIKVYRPDSFDASFLWDETNDEWDLNTNFNISGNLSISGTVDGRDVAADGTKLDGIESGATADQTASEILTAIKTVDGTGSGLDADLLDGIQASAITQSGDSVALTGDVTGSTTVAADGAISIATTIAANSVELGTDTSGNYVATITGTANEVEVSGSGSESAAVTIGLPNDVTIGNDLTVTGDLIVNGTTTTVNSNTVEIGDSIITLNSDEAGTPSQNAGIEVERGTSTNVQLRWNETNDKWEVTEDGAAYSNILTTADEGTGNGLDADTVDGVEASSFLRSDAADTKTSGDLSFADNVKAQFGTGNDLQIYHDGTNSRIADFGTGELRLQGTNLRLWSASGENYLTALENGAVSLYYDNSAKIATTSTGVDVAGNITVSGTVDGRDVAADGTKLDGIEAGATADQTASEILTAIKTVDGAGSGLDADTLDGQEGTYYLDGANFTGTLPNDYVTLGTNTTGNYVATITGTANEVEVTGSGSETAAVTIGLPDDVTIGNELTVTTGLFTPLINTLQVDNGNGDDAFSTAVGVNALINADSGTLRNTAFGRAALEDNTSGERNTALGEGAMANATTGSYNTAIGQGVMGSGIVTGNFNTALGITALNKLTSGPFNTAIGSQSPLGNTTTGQSNVAIGPYTLINNEEGSYNVAVGRSALAGASLGDYTGNIAIGANALDALEPGQNNNTVIGYRAGRDLDTGTRNAIIGFDAEASATSVNDEITLGDDANKSFRIPGSSFYINGGSEGTTGSRVGINTSTPTAQLDVNGNINVTGTVTADELVLADNEKIKLGSSVDFEIYHDGSNSYVKDIGTGVLNIQGSSQVNIGGADGTIGVQFVEGANVTLRHNNVPILTTASTGINVTGNVVVSGTVDGRDVATDGTKLDTIETNATADQTAAEILTAIKTVDGTGSGLDADTLDGQEASAFQTVAAPNAPSITSTTVVNETIELVFGQSSTSGVTRYEVWSDGATGSDYSLIAIIPAQDAAASMSVVDTSFDTGGTVAYRVYAIKNGVYSTAATTTKSFTIPSLDVTNMSVVSSITNYDIQYDLPETRFLDHIEIYKDAETTLGALSRTGAALIYSGSSDNFTYNVTPSDKAKYHQFWVEVVSV